MDQDTVLGLVRHGLTGAGGALITQGYVTGTQWQDIVGGIVAVIGVAWSIWQKRQQKTALAVAVTGAK